MNSNTTNNPVPLIPILREKKKVMLVREAPKELAEISSNSFNGSGLDFSAVEVESVRPEIETLLWAPTQAAEASGMEWPFASGSVSQEPHQVEEAVFVEVTPSVPNLEQVFRVDPGSSPAVPPLQALVRTRKPMVELSLPQGEVVATPVLESIIEAPGGSDRKVIELGLPQSEVVAATVLELREEPSADFGTPTPVVIENIIPELVLLRSGLGTVSEIPPLVFKPRDIHGYVIVGMDPDSGEEDIHGIYLPDELNRLPGETLLEKVVKLCKDKFSTFQDPNLVAAMNGGHITTVVTSGNNVPNSPVVTRVNMNYELEDDVNQEGSYTCYTFKVVKFKMNNLGSTLRISTL